LNIQQQSLIADLLQHEDVQERLSIIVERCRRVPHFSLAERTPDHRVPGCASSVWLIAKTAHGVADFRADADSPVVRGLVTLLAEFFSGMTPVQILAQTDDPLELLNLKRGLSPTRRHGLEAVAAVIRQFASAQLGSATRPPLE
jgi:cysteine desulfuration protein SufE